TPTGTADPLALEQSVLRPDLRQAELEAYGEVLAAILDGEVILSVRGDAAEECWRIVDQVLAAWRSGAVPMTDYQAGSPVPADWHPALGSTPPRHNRAPRHSRAPVPAVGPTPTAPPAAARPAAPAPPAAGAR